MAESAIPARGRRARLWRRYYYLQYLRLLYRRYKAAYTRDYYRATTGLDRPAALDYADYTDYSDYGDYADYDYSGNGLFARIVKAVKLNRNRKVEKETETEGSSKGGFLAGSVQDNFQFPQGFLDSLPPLEDIDYDELSSLNDQFELIN